VLVRRGPGTGTDPHVVDVDRAPNGGRVVADDAPGPAIDFYRKLAAELRRRKMVLSVEICAFFNQPEFGGVKADYSGLTPEKFARGLHAMAQTVLGELAPDHLTLLGEPDTFLKNTGMKATSGELLKAVAEASRDLDHGSTKLGICGGTWSELSWFEAIAEIPTIDVINIHIYAIQGELMTQKVRQIAELAAKSRLAAIFSEREFVDAGGLLSYGPSSADLSRRAAIYVDKILKGAKPGDLPVQQPTRFELVINLKTAKKIGITIPPEMLARADKVIR